MPYTEEGYYKYLLPRFSTGNVDNVEIQITSKLLNGNLTTIKPLVQLHTEVILEREIGRPREWKRLHAQDLTDSVIKYITSRIVFGDALAGNEPFLHALERYVSMVIPLSLALRFVSLGPLKHAFMWLIHWANRRDLATATRYVVELINERRRTQASKKLSEDEKPVDAIQWAMEQDIAEHLKKPEVIAHRILHQCSAIMQTPAVAMGHLLYDVASHPGCLDELREEITSCLAEDGGSGWTQNAMARMKKLDSFVQECFRMNSMVTPLTGWRVVTSDTFRFDDGLILPRGTLLTFPTIHVQNDPDIHPNPTKFDFLRFYRLKEEDRRAGVPSFNRDLKTEWLSFGYGRQACPGRFFAVRLLKTIVGELILRYDIRYAGGNRARPAVLDVEPITVPDRTVELEFRARV
ncbi:cytochrome P450 [Aspergillus filifer]